MSRTEFMRSLGATCKNPAWSWSFIDEVNKKIIFGAWDDLKSEDGKKVLILSDNWRENKQGSLKAGYTQSLEHLDKIIFEGYSLYTFKQIRKPKSDEREAASIESFEEKITLKYLERIGDGWFATDKESFNYTPELGEKYFEEGGQKERLVTYYERNPKARKECIDHYGLNCQACGFNFEEVYGELGRNYIHVHHKEKISTIKKNHRVDPIDHLVPLCANCHAMIHIGSEMKTVEDIKKLLQSKL